MKAYWMWHWGEYEIYHTNWMSDRREKHGGAMPTMWSGASTYPVVEFSRDIQVEQDTVFTFHFCGKGYLLINDRSYRVDKPVALKAGHYHIIVRVSNFGGLPAVFIENDYFPSGEGWLCSRVTAERTPVAWLAVYDSPLVTPETFPFAYETVYPLSAEERVNENGTAGTLYDFGKELFGHVDLSDLHADKTYGVFYGESDEEALAHEQAILFEYVQGVSSARLTQRAFRYIFVENPDKDAIRLCAQYEYLPLEQKGFFRSDNELFNRVWEMCRYTFHLNCRETYLDGIKRDRWPWSGDAYQSYHINQYLYMDQAIDQRTSIGLRGKDPTEQHINNILDYSLYWIISLDEYYMTYGDSTFIQRIFPRVLTMYDFIHTREDENGFLVGKEGDWTFIDWSDIDKHGAVCAEQMLYIRTKQAMASLCAIVGEDGSVYEAEARALIKRVNAFYWDAEKGAYIDSFSSGKRNVTRHANIFALLFSIADQKQQESIAKNVLLSDRITKITTPYFEGFELDAMCRIGNFAFFENMIASYWGKMLELGADTVWEEFDPTMQGSAHYAMYGDRFGKSLCHAWGATPIYLLGRYYLGVYPTNIGYKTFRVEPNRGGLGEIEGCVPLPTGTVYVHLTQTALTVKTDVDGGTLVWQGKEYALPKGEEYRIACNP